VKAFIVGFCLFGFVGCTERRKTSFYFGTEKIACVSEYSDSRYCGLFIWCEDGRHFKCVTNVRID
jgi:hypothetical protein